MTPLRHRCTLSVVAWLSFVAVLFGVSAAPASAASAEQVLEEQILGQLNAERAARGLPAFTADPGLAQASENWAGSMASQATMVHSTDGRAEIIARGFRTGQITDAWMRSSGHRNLIVDPNLRWAGVGIRCDAAGQMWAVVQFNRADTSIGTLSSSAASPVATPSTSGSGCGTASSSPTIQRLYAAYFRRASDQAGLDYWVGRIQAGASVASVSEAFAASAEFQATYGRLSNRDFVRLIYVNVLGREPDQGGYDYWVGLLNSGRARGEIMVGFSESNEFRTRTGIY